MPRRDIAESALELAVAQLRLAEGLVEVEKQRIVTASWSAMATIRQRLKPS